MAFVSYDQYVPNNNFDPIELNVKGLAGIAQKQQNDYDSNFLKLSALKQGYLNIDLLNQEDKDQLNQYNQVLGDWFDKNRNANFADSRTIEDVSKLFNPISKNPDLLAGARTTALFKQSQQLIEQSKKDKTYSSTSHANLMHDMENYRNAKGPDKLNWNPRPYVPDCDYGKNFSQIAAKIKPSSELIDPSADPSWINNGGAMSGTRNEVNTQRYLSAFAGAADDCFQNQMRERSYYNLNTDPTFKNKIYQGKVGLTQTGINDATRNIAMLEQQLKQAEEQGYTKDTPQYIQLAQQKTQQEERLALLNTEYADLNSQEGLNKFLNRSQGEFLNDATEILGFETLHDMAQGFAYSNITGGRFTNNRQQELKMQQETAIKIQAMKGAQAQAKASSSGKTQVGTNADGSPIYLDGITDDKSINTQTVDGYSAFVDANLLVNNAYKESKTNLASSLGITDPIAAEEVVQKYVQDYKNGLTIDPSKIELVEAVIEQESLARDSNSIMGQLSDEALKRVNAKVGNTSNDPNSLTSIATGAAFGNSPLDGKQVKYKTVSDLTKGSSISLDLNAVVPDNFKAPSDPSGILHYFIKNGIDINNIPLTESTYLQKASWEDIKNGKSNSQKTTIGKKLALSGSSEIVLTKDQATELQAYLNKPEIRDKAALAMVDYVNTVHNGDNNILGKYVKGSGVVDYYKEYNQLAKGVTFASKTYPTVIGDLDAKATGTITRTVSPSFNSFYDIYDEDGNKVDLQPEEIVPQSSNRTFTNVRVKLAKAPGENAKSKTYTIKPKGENLNSGIYPVRTISTDDNSISLNIPNDPILNQFSNQAVVKQGTIKNKAESVWVNAMRLDDNDKIDHTEVVKTNKGEAITVKIDPKFRVPSDRTSGFIYDVRINNVIAETYIKNEIAKMKNPPPGLEASIRGAILQMSKTDPDELLRVIKEFLINK